METAIQLLVLILLVAMTGIVNSLLSYLFDYCLWPGSIFGRWLPFLSRRLATKPFLAEISKRRLFGLSEADAEDQIIDSVSHHFFYKILGGCIICTNVWLGMIVFTILHFAEPIVFHWYLAPVHVVVSSAFLRKFLINHAQ